MSDHENVLRDLLLECGVDGVTLWHIRCLASYLAAGGVSRQPRSEARQRLAADLTCSHDDEMRVLADWDDARWTAERSRGGVVWAGGFDDDSATRWRLWRTALNRHLLQRGVRRRGRDGFRDGRWGEWETVEAIDGPTSEAIRIASVRAAEYPQPINVAPPLEDPAFQALGLPPDMVNASLDAGAQNSSRTAQEIEELHGAPALTVIECDHHPNTDCARCR